jgi:molecular chaperone GrpE
MSDAEETSVEVETEASAVDVVAEIAAHDEELAETVQGHLDRVEELEADLEETAEELESVTERLEHTRADFRNYKERAKRRQEEIKERATENLIERLLDVRDNLSRALEEQSDDVDSLREGVKLTRKQFDRVLDAENVQSIDPELGAEVDANRHEVLQRIDSDQPADTIASVYRPGYEMAGKVLRPAQVTVSEGTEEDRESEKKTEPSGDEPSEEAVGEGEESTDSTKESTAEEEGEPAADSPEEPSPDSGNETEE